MGRRRASAGQVTAAEYVARKARLLDAMLGKAYRRVLGDADEEALHDMRVAIRRIRSLLRVARPLYGRFHADAVRRAFTEVQSKTGDLRDEEALEETMAQLGVEDPLFLAWREKRREREKRLRAAVVKGLRRGDLSRARRLLRALFLLPVKPSRDKTAERFALRCVQRAKKNVEKLRHVPTSDVEKMHALRIRHKELRYTAEMFGDCLPQHLADLAGPSAKFQKRLGEIHDIDMGLDALSRARGLPPETRARVAAALVEVRARKARKYLDENLVPPETSRHGAPESSTQSAAPSLARAEAPVKAAPQEVGVVGLRKISTF